MSQIKNAVSNMPEWFKNAIVVGVLWAMAVAGTEVIKQKLAVQHEARPAHIAHGDIGVNGLVLEKFLALSEKQMQLQERQIAIQQELVDSGHRIETLARESNAILKDHMGQIDAPIRMLGELHRKFFATSTGR